MTMVPEFTLGDRLRKARLLTGMTLPQFAAEIMTSQKTINNYETDRVKPQPIRLEKWVEVTGVSRAWLLSGEPELHS